jgi:hypothetical protein
MSIVIEIIGAADGKTPTPHDRRFVVEWNPHTKAGIFECSSTGDINQAKQWSTIKEGLDEWNTVSKVETHRSWDGKLNRPLTAVNIAFANKP